MRKGRGCLNLGVTIVSFYLFADRQCFLICSTSAALKDTLTAKNSVVASIFYVRPNSMIYVHPEARIMRISIFFLFGSRPRDCFI